MEARNHPREVGWTCGRAHRDAPRKPLGVIDLSITRHIQRLRLIPRLGFTNSFRILLYRGLSRIGFYRLRLPLGVAYPGPFLISSGSSRPIIVSPELISRAERVLAGELPFYGHDWKHVGFPPDWTAIAGQNRRHWTDLDEFSGGDIKEAWEPSRFAGLAILAHAGAGTADQRYIKACDSWLSTWVAANPWNHGIQWRCAQETALRLMASIQAVDLLEHHAGAYPTAALLRFVREHARRIVPTKLYAVAQDNNHATSEACGLFVAGAFLQQHTTVDDAECQRWLAQGRAGIETHLCRLVMPDGSFSQHSVNYHRLMLDTLVLAELWRRRIGGQSWSPLAQERLGRASGWLESLIDPCSGGAPNLGANDGARFFATDPAPNRDFRSSADNATTLFLGRRLTITGGDSTLATHLGIGSAGVDPSALPPDKSELKIFPDGGYAVWRLSAGRLMLRLPVYRFRPSHCDALHLDLFWQGVNVLRDGGSFSYNSTPDRSPYFSGVASHNTVQFDGRDQMPRLGRFLWGEWPSGTWRQDGERAVTAAYTDWRGARHHRRVNVDGKAIIIDDVVSGFKRDAVQRWRLPPGKWALNGRNVTGPLCSFQISGDGDFEVRIVDGEESLCYQESTPVDVIEIKRPTPGRISTRIQLQQDCF